MHVAFVGELVNVDEKPLPMPVQPFDKAMRLPFMFAEHIFMQIISQNGKQRSAVNALLACLGCQSEVERCTQYLQKVVIEAVVTRKNEVFGVCFNDTMPLVLHLLPML